MGAIESLNEAARIHDALCDRLETASAGLLERYPVAGYVRLFDDAPGVQGYRHVPEPAARWTSEIESRAGSTALEDYLRLVLATLIRDREDRTRPLRIASSVTELLERAYLRILAQLETGEGSFFTHRNDLYAKDFGLCRLKLLPCGSEHVDVASGVPRSLLLKNGAGQCLRGLWFFVARRRGFRQWLEGHWDRRLAREFNPKSYDRCYLRIAELLELNPDVAGLMGSSWWFDPAVETISPGLGFLRRVQLENGAALFRVGENDTATEDATMFSKERQEAFETGRYRPAVYLVAWAREDILAWARTQTG